jgi:hypothetical protein
LEREDDLGKLRMRVWDRFLTVRAVNGETISFEQYWYEFLARYTESPADTYEGICKDLEQQNSKKR